MKSSNNLLPIKVALVTTEYVTETNSFDGGLANYIHRVALSLKQLGYHPVICVISNKNEKLIYQGIEVYRLKIRGRNIIRVINLLTLTQIRAWTSSLWTGFYLNHLLRKLHKTCNFSIIQYPSCLGLGFFRIPEIPSIIRISAYIPLWNQAYELNRTLNIRLGEKVEDMAYSKADALFAPSLLNAQAVEQAIGRKVKVIETPFILDTTELDESIYTTHLKDKKYLLFFGTIGLMKGCGLIAEIIYPLLQSYPDLYFVFVGKDKGYLGFQGKSIMEEIKNNAAENQDRVIHFNRLTHNYLYPIIAHAYAVVLPSRVDNFPNTCLEAMAHKKIVIGTQGTSFEQLIIDRVSGFLCDKDNAKDLLQTIDKALKLTPEQKTKIENKAGDRIAELAPKKVVEELVQFYREVIADFSASKSPD
jgi:glycosyltransferase involved in cell wall biosynthesis